MSRGMVHVVLVCMREAFFIVRLVGREALLGPSFPTLMLGEQGDPRRKQVTILNHLLDNVIAYLGRKVYVFMRSMEEQELPSWRELGASVQNLQRPPIPHYSACPVDRIAFI
jgi:hypothetical protein